MLDYKDFCEKNAQLIESIGGMVSANNVKNGDALRGCLGRYYTALNYIEGSDVFKVISGAVMVCTGIIQTHPFNDGNKRTALWALVNILEDAKIGFDANEYCLTSIIILLAQNKITEDKVIDLIYNRIVPFLCEDNDITNKALELLFKYDCKSLSEEENDQIESCIINLF